jgi:hypothetical protein
MFSAFNEPSAVLHRGGIKQCGLWKGFYTSVIAVIGGKIENVENVKTHIESYQYLLSDCSHCATRAGMWGTFFDRQISAVPNFSHFLSV